MILFCKKVTIIGFDPSNVIQPTYLYSNLYSCKYISLDVYSLITTSKEKKLVFTAPVGEN